MADDLTGALEAGEKLSDLLTPAIVFNDLPVDFGSNQIRKYQVVIINSESRHLSRLSAGRKIRLIVRSAQKAGIG